MANIFKNPSYRANIGYSGFDMSHKKMFSSTIGELLPVYYDLLQPGDKVSLNTILKTRTMELASAAMAQINEHLEWFFVPMTQIYSAFGDFYYQIQDLKSSLMDRQLIDGRIPFFSAANFLNEQAPVHRDMFYQNSFARLLDWFYPYSASIDLEGVLNPSTPTGFCPIFLCAYQKIFMDFYRDSNRIWNDPNCYSLDKYYSNNSIPTADFGNFVQLRYRPRRKDFYMNTFVSPLFGSGDVSSFNYSENSIYESFRQWVVKVKEYGVTADNSNIDFNGSAGTPSMQTANAEPTAITPAYGVRVTPTVTNLKDATLEISNSLSPTAIRTSFAVAKLMEITRRAGKHYDQQTLAHFGVDVPTGINGEVTYIGGTDSVINIGDVIATATAQAGNATSVLGQVAGKGYGYSNGKDLKFTAPCHGILMCIYSADVEANYDNRFIDRLNLLMSRADWFTEEYDNLGMQPLFYYETPLFDSSTSASYYLTVGWQYRYSELKCKRNTCHGALGLNGTLRFWTTHNEHIYDTQSGAFDVSSYYCSPWDLDNIMLVGYSTTLNDDNAQLIYHRDPLIHELFFDVKKSSKMSTYGLEQL